MTDLLGNELTALELELLDAHRLLKVLAARRDSPPCVERNVRKALAAVHQAALDLALAVEWQDGIEAKRDSELMTPGPGAGTR